ncbi:MAG: methyl-accepting chemotaxis protein [Halobacteriales archaeon]|nr:methyl-accepting chemotaxis protein [Halobacteriales archaeon]
MTQVAGAWLRGSYAAKLVIALLAVSAIVIGYGTVTHLQTSEQVRENVRANLRADAELQASEFDTWLDSVRTQAATTSDHPVFASGDTDRIQSRLKELMANDQVPEAVVAVHYLDSQSMEIVTSSADSMVGVSPKKQGAAFAEDPPEFDGPDDTYVSQPFRIPAVDFPVVAVISPIEGADHKAIVYMVNIGKRTEALGQSGEKTTVIVNSDGRFIAHPNPDKIGTKHEGGGDLPAIKQALDGTTGVTEMVEQNRNLLMSYTGLESKDWVVMVHVPKQEAFAVGSSVLSGIIGLIFVAMTSIAVVGVTVGSNTLIALKQLSSKAEQMANGDLDVELTTGRRDEFGTLYASFANLRDSLREKITEVEAERQEAEAARQEAEEMRSQLEEKAEEYRTEMQAIADGDLSRRLDPNSSNQAMAEIGEEFNEMIADIELTLARLEEFALDVATAAEEVEGSATEVKSASREVTEAVQEISDGATRQDTQLQEISGEMSDFSASAEEIAATVDSIAQTSNEAAAAGESGREAAETAIDEINQVEAETSATVEEIQALDEEMNEIGEIVEVIRDIAEQTNILALNASIEAARSNNQNSDGFSVVADEVKSLAEETKESAEEIEQRIERLQEQTGKTVEDIQQTSERVETGVETVENALQELERIVDRVEDADSAIQEINDATGEQAESLQRVSAMIDEVADISNETVDEAEGAAAATEQQTASIDEVTDEVSALAERADSLKELLRQFTIQQETGEGIHPTDPTPTNAPVTED